MILMTRRDYGVGVGEFDSIKWLFDVVLREPDLGWEENHIDSAVVYGQESNPYRIEFYSLESPAIQDTPIRVWIRPEAA